MATSENKYLDLTGLQTLVNEIKEEDAKKVDKVSGLSAHNSGFYKVTTNEQGLVTAVTDVVKADITGLDIPGADTNQKIKAGSVTFGDNEVVNIVAGDNISVTGASSGTGAPKITIAYTGAATDHNQTVKSGSVEFGVDDKVNIKADTTTGNPIEVTGNATNKEITIKHGTTTPVSAAAVKVGKDQWGHVVLGAQIDYSELSGTPTIGNGTLTLKAGSNTKTFTANQTGNETFEITAANLGLDSAMHFKGKLNELPATTNYVAGDVVLVGTKEYVLNDVSGTKSWVELGDEGSHALKTTQVIAGSGLTGGGALSGDVTISHATKTAVDPAPKAIGYDQYGHVVIGTALTTANDGSHTHTVTGSVTVPTVSSDSVKLKVTTTNSDSFVKSYPGATSKLATTTVTGVSGSTTASKATAGTSVVYGTADVGSAVKYGTANVKSTGTVYGKANVASSTTTVATGFASGNAYSASYNAEDCCLELTALTLNTTGIYEAVAAPNTQVLYEAVEAPNNQTLTPAKAADTTRKITPYTFADVTVPQAASSATTVATGSLSVNGGGDSVMTGLGTAVTGTAIGSVTLGTTPDAADVTVAGPVTVGSTSVSLSGGSAASAGGHTHTIEGGKISS